MEQLVTTYSQYSIKLERHGIKNCSPTLNGLSIQKIYFQPESIWTLRSPNRFGDHSSVRDAAGHRASDRSAFTASSVCFCISLSSDS